MDRCNKPNSILRSFEPIVNKESKVLILGTMPGGESLKQQQYYAHPRNLFWPFIYEIFGEKPKSDYDDKILFLKEKKIALWDVYKSCEREGSLDLNIRQEVLNDVAELLKNHRNIKYVFCNGGTAEKQFIRNVLPQINHDIFYMRLPSTSPANASIPFNKKREQWFCIRHALENHIRFKSVVKSEFGLITILADETKVTDVYLPGKNLIVDNFAVFLDNIISTKAKNQINEYIRRYRKFFDIPIEISGSPFQKKVYSALLQVPYGATVSYGELAEMAGNKKAARAVGQAVRKNPIPIIIPCHRVIGSNGKNVGFMGVRNNPIQNILLALESS